MFHVSIKGIELAFETSTGVFSPDAADRGTLAMLSQVEFLPEDRVLDLGCGYGLVGILAARLIGAERVVMSDNNPEAVRLAAQNAEANGVTGVQVVLSDGFIDIAATGFTKILSNPPYHTDFSVAKAFIEKGFNRLALGGKFYMVTKRREWYKNKFISIFGGVTIAEIDGYFVFCAERRSASYASQRNSKTAR